MKRYIRTKDNKIFDSTKPIEQAFTKNGCGGFRIMPNIKGAVKEADTIEELIEVGDLINRNGIINYCDDEDYIMSSIKFAEITELYTKQGRNYILVAENINGEWSVI